MAKLKIALFCSGGMSSSLAGANMQKVFDKEEKDVQVDAYDLGMVDEIGDEVDVIMLAPQISWDYDAVKKSFPEKKVIKLTMQEFGSMSGQVLIDRLTKEGIKYE
ncbi:transcription antiterminator [Pediococcus inopinatus]|uniref:PTS sugar transporter subunit IIB n=1 Tax=Pediococcus inopinatus TaxID=114090 RepID=UPI002B262DA3|nr:transcription antiterminator [Pediococcus inopinatus]WPC18317.1 transcription antiterminator [Pediococcus inopinatus]